MAIRHVAGLALVIVAGGCSPLLEPCQAGTLVVAVSLVGAVANADSFTIDLSLDGGSVQEKTLAHTPGATSGNVVVQFPHGYPSGSTLAVRVIAMKSGVAVGEGHADATLSGACQATSLTIAPATPDAGAARDLSGVVADDLAGAGGADDLAAATVNDLGHAPDLSLLPDMVCPGGGVEHCFDGIDNDCDGKIDCADPDCAPVAVCVPTATGGFVYATEEPTSGACPAGTTGGAVYQKDVTGGGCASTCKCNTSGCSASLTSVIPCPGGALSGNTIPVDNTHCANIEDQNNFRVGPVSGTLACADSGSAAPVTPPALTATLACTMTATAVAGGCNVGDACVVRGTKQCVSIANTVACPTNYPNGNGITWYGMYNDTRSCSCSCATAAGGCTDANVGLDFFDSKQCMGTAHPESGDICSNGLLGAEIIGGCTLSVTLNNPMTFSVPRTVCCE